MEQKNKSIQGSWQKEHIIKVTFIIAGYQHLPGGVWGHAVIWLCHVLRVKSCHLRYFFYFPHNCYKNLFDFGGENILIASCFAHTGQCRFFKDTVVSPVTLVWEPRAASIQRVSKGKQNNLSRKIREPEENSSEKPSQWLRGPTLLLETTHCVVQTALYNPKAWAFRMALWKKCWPQAWGTEFNSQQPCRRLGAVVCACNPSAGEEERGLSPGLLVNWWDPS